MRVFKDGSSHWNAEDIATFNRLRSGKETGSMLDVIDRVERNKAAKRKRAQKRFQAFVDHANENGGVEHDPEVMAFREIQDDLGISTGQVFKALPTVEIKPLQRRGTRPTRR